VPDAVSSLVSRALAIALVGLLLTTAVSAAPAAFAQVASGEPTLVLTPRFGAAGTTVRMSGSGWGTTVGTPHVTLESQDGEADADAAVDVDEEGRLTGSVSIPVDLLGGRSMTVRACAISGGDDAVETCASARFRLDPPTLTAMPSQGAAGTAVELQGSGWGETGSVVTVTAASPDAASDGHSRVDDGVLTGSVTVPPGLAGGTDVTVQACVPASGQPTCVRTRYSVEPTLTVDPAEALPGATLELGGSWCCFAGRDVIWSATRAVIGTTRTNPDGVVSGSARIPLDADEGDGQLAVCDGDVDAPTCATATVDVKPPTLRTDRSDYEIGAPVEIVGEGWCCPDDAVRVTGAANGLVWGDGTVDEAGELHARATVPDGSARGAHDLSVCVGTRCRTVGLDVVLPAPSTAEPTTAPPGTTAPSVTTVPATTAPSVTTSPTIPPPTTTPPDPDPTDHTWWSAAALLIVAGVAGAGIARRRSRVSRAARPVATPRPAVHELAPPTPVAIVVTVDPPDTSTEARSPS
jgi:hypothetical protein